MPIQKINVEDFWGAFYLTIKDKANHIGRLVGEVWREDVGALLEKEVQGFWRDLLDVSPAESEVWLKVDEAGKIKGVKTWLSDDWIFSGYTERLVPSRLVDSFVTRVLKKVERVIGVDDLEDTSEWDWAWWVLRREMERIRRVVNERLWERIYYGWERTKREQQVKERGEAE